MKKNETKPHCKFYDFHSAPSAYGAFCVVGHQAKCFSKDSHGKLTPQCWGCKKYKQGAK